MNHGSGFIIGIGQKYKNPNRTLTKINFIITLIAFIFEKNLLRVSFSVAKAREQLLRLNSIVLMIFRNYQKHLHLLLSSCHSLREVENKNINYRPILKCPYPGLCCA